VEFDMTAARRRGRATTRTLSAVSDTGTGHGAYGEPWRGWPRGGLRRVGSYGRFRARCCRVMSLPACACRPGWRARAARRIKARARRPVRATPQITYPTE